MDFSFYSVVFFLHLSPPHPSPVGQELHTICSFSNVDAVEAENTSHKTFMAPVPPVATAEPAVWLRASLKQTLAQAHRHRHVKTLRFTKMILKFRQRQRKVKVLETQILINDSMRLMFQTWSCSFIRNISI